MNEKQQVLNLTNICDGKLEAEFEEMYKDALRKISKGRKLKSPSILKCYEFQIPIPSWNLVTILNQHYQLSHVVLSGLMRTTLQ